MILEKEFIGPLALILADVILLCAVWFGWVIKEIFHLAFDSFREYQQKRKAKRQKKG